MMNIDEAKLISSDVDQRDTIPRRDGSHVARGRQVSAVAREGNLSTVIARREVPRTIRSRPSDAGPGGTCPDKWLVLFDMDGTLLPGTTSAQEISRLAGVHDEICDLEQRYALKEVDSLEFSVAALRLWERGGPDVFRLAWDAAPKLHNIDLTLDILHRNGAITCLITMAHREFAECFSKFGHVYGSEYGRRIVNPEDKPRIAASLADQFHIVPERIAAFGDSDSDVPLFEFVAHSVAVNGSQQLRALARYSYVGTDCHQAAALAFPEWFKDR